MNGIECAFTGAIGTAPGLRQSKAGKPWCAFNVRVGDGETAQWVRIACFGAMADEAAKLARGASVYVEGRIKLDTWRTDAGEQRAGLSVAASHVQPLGQIGRRRPSGTAKARSPQVAAADWQAPLGEPSDPLNGGDPMPF